jgi:general stress protein YciG
MIFACEVIHRHGALDREDGALTKTSRRGLASKSFFERIEIASRGGKAAPPETRSFSKDKVLAAEAGRKGGKAVKAANRSFSRDPALAAEAGRRGALERQRRRALKLATT